MNSRRFLIHNYRMFVKFRFKGERLWLRVLLVNDETVVDLPVNRGLMFGQKLQLCWLHNSPSRWRNKLYIYNLLKDIKLIYAYSVIFGFTTSVNYVLQSSLVIEALGLANLTLGFGCLQLSQGFSTLSGTVLLGWLKDNMDNYNMVFHISGSIMILSGLILILWPFTKPKKAKRQHSNLNGNEMI